MLKRRRKRPPKRTLRKTTTTSFERVAHGEPVLPKDQLS
jgi:hypothetical protein